MNVKWLIESTSIPEDVGPLLEALDKQGIEYKELEKHSLYKSSPHEIYDPSECVVFFGTLQTAQKLRRESQWIPGVYYNVSAYNCDHYYPHIGDLLLNREYIMLPFGDLLRQKELLYAHLGEDRSIFLRPNRGDKIFTGKVIYKEDFDKEVVSLGYGQIDPHELVVAARPINLEKEWRFVCVDTEVVTGSCYKEHNFVGYQAGYTEEALEIAKQAISKYRPDPVWVVDVGLTKGGRYAVVEVGCFSCAGLYLCDREAIVKKVSQAALNEWQEYEEE